MASPLVSTASVLQCLHAGQVSIVSSNTRVRLSGQPAALVSDTYPIARCPFTIPPPSPCVLVQWVVPAARVRILGQPVILQASTGLGLAASQAPQGRVSVVTTQQRVSGL